MNNDILLRFKDSEKFFICPICKKSFVLYDNSLICTNKHCFDISKYGYVNFAPHTRQQKNYDKQSFENRKIILESGFYSHILNKVIEILKHMDTVKTILDTGCGEGFYSRQISELTDKKMIGFDISKDSVQLAAKSDHNHDVKWFVGDLTKLPLKDHSIDGILDIFSPANYEEFHRILTDNGYLIKVIPGNNHLKELREKAKQYLKNKEYSNQKIITYMKQYFSVVCQKTATTSFKISPKEREIFIHMTPLLFHVDKEKIDWTDVDYLTIEAEILIGRVMTS